MRSLTTLALCWLACACGNGDGHAPKDPIVVGIMSGFTGRDSNIGQGERSAAELAVAEVNSAGGLLDGRHVKLVTADDALDPEQGKREAQRIVEQENAVAFVGPDSSSVMLSVIDFTAEAHVPNVSCCATSDTLDTAAQQGKRDRYFFRTVAPDSFQAPVLARAAIECHACTALAVFHRDDSYGNPFAKALASEFKTRSKGGTVAYDVAYDPHAASYRAQVQAAAASAADCAVLIAYSTDGAHLRRDWASFAGRDVKWLASEGIIGNNFAEKLADVSLGQGLVATGPVFAPVTPEAQSFATAYNATYGHAPGAYNAQVYDGMALLLLAIAKGESVDGDSIRDNLFVVSAPAADPKGEFIVNPGRLSDGLAAIAAGKDVNYEGASGPVDLEDYGNVRSQYEIYEFDEKGEFKTVGVVPDSGKLPCP
jgi:ABC-type branched-subunit amino acid transport system substrate-binding protein